MSIRSIPAQKKRKKNILEIALGFKQEKHIVI